MVCSGRVESVSVSSFGEGLAVWVLPSRVDRDRRAERTDWFGVTEFVQVSQRGATSAKSPTAARPDYEDRSRLREAFGK